MQTTSLSAYSEIKPQLAQKQAEVLEAFKHKEEFTNAEVADFLKWPINSITPRVLELRGKSLLEEARRRICKVTGNMAIAWRLAKLIEPVRQSSPSKEVQDKQHSWIFESKSNPKLKHTVIDFTTCFICDCIGYSYRKSCSHIEQVKKMLAQKQAIRKTTQLTLIP